MTLDRADDKPDDTVTLTAIEPSRLGLPAEGDWAAHVRPVRVRAMPAPSAVNAFNDGRVDLVTGGQIQDFPLTRSVGILRGTIKLDPVVGLFGLQVMHAEGFLAAPANREALAMAIDRDGLMAPFGVGGWTPTTQIVSPGVEGDTAGMPERWSANTLDQRRAVATARVRAWSRGGGPVRVSVALPRGEGSQILFGHLAADFAAIGVALVRAGVGEEADLALVDDVARYPRASWFLHRLSCPASRGMCSEQADNTLAQADAAPTPDGRAALIAQAQGQITAANVFIPFGTPIRWSLVRGSAGGFAPNPWGWHPLMPLAQLPK